MPSTALFRRLIASTSVVLVTFGGLTVAAPSASASPADPGTITSWGYNSDGQTDVPASLEGKDVTAVSAGFLHSLALSSDGTVTGWGHAGYGQNDIPASLTGQTVTAIAAGWSSDLALTSDGKVTAWGSNHWGLLDVPASLANKTVTDIATNQSSSLALTDDGEVTAWGYDSYGQNTVPASLEGKTVTAIAAGEYNNMALTSEGEVISWGRADYGQNDVPASLDGKVVTAIDSGESASMALTDDGKVTVWGANYEGQQNVPAELADKTVTAISSGTAHDLALTSEGTVVAWGPNYVGELNVPQGLERVTQISAGHYHNLAIVGGTTTIDLTGSVEVTGTPKVGETLTADSSTIESTPEADLSGQWLRDGEAIVDATGSTYALTNADAGATITHQVTATATGYDDVKVTSNGVGPVDGGVITLPAPTVTGTPVVDGTLTASLSDTTLDPADADVTYEWTRGLDVVGTGSTYTPSADDAGEQLTVTATASKEYFDDATSSTNTDAVAEADFTTGPVATITGTLKVGEMLTAGTGVVAPTAESFDYQWYADDTAVADADASTFTLTPAQKDATMSVEVTATRPGYTSASDTSTRTSAVATDLAPTLDLDAAKSNLRRGQATRLTWASDEASSLAASGGWAGDRNENGTATVRPTRLGGTSYVLKATNANGTTTAMVTVQVRRQAKALRVWASNGLRLRGNNVRVAARGLDARETYVVRVAGTQVATGRAAVSGKLNRAVTIPTGTRAGNARVTVIGSESDRIGGDTVRVVRNKTLGLKVAHKTIRASDDQKATVTGLAPGEKVTLTYQGKRISPKGARANSRGSYKKVFDVDIYWGAKSVKAVGKFSGRSATQTFEVVRRCYTGPTCA